MFRTATIIGGGTGVFAARVERALLSAAVRGRAMESDFDDDEAMVRLAADLPDVVVVCGGAGGTTRCNPFDVARRLDELPRWEQRPVVVVLSDLGRVTFDMMLAQHLGEGLLTPAGLDCILLVHTEHLDDAGLGEVLTRHIVRVASRSRRSSNPDYGSLSSYPIGWVEPPPDAAPLSTGGHAPA